MLEWTHNTGLKFTISYNVIFFYNIILYTYVFVLYKHIYIWRERKRDLDLYYSGLLGEMDNFRAGSGL